MGASTIRPKMLRSNAVSPWTTPRITSHTPITEVMRDHQRSHMYSPASAKPSAGLRKSTKRLTKTTSPDPAATPHAREETSDAGPPPAPTPQKNPLPTPAPIALTEPEAQAPSPSLPPAPTPHSTNPLPREEQATTPTSAATTTTTTAITTTASSLPPPSAIAATPTITSTKPPPTPTPQPSNNSTAHTSRPRPTSSPRASTEHDREEATREVRICGSATSKAALLPFRGARRARRAGTRGGCR